jgi:ATP-dependent RNA helicase RhlE
MKFESYHISQTVKDNLKQLGLKRPTDIQFKAIPSILKGEDVLAIAQTGTGKTAAFAIPLIDTIHRSKSSRRTRGIKGLVMVPTRELAAQIGDVLEQLARKTRVKILSIFGGVDQDPQINQLIWGVDLIVATPGRLFDLISQGVISLSSLDTLVIDEADQMLDLGFIKDIQAVKKKIKKRHQTLFFSATINREIKKLAFSQVKSNAIRIQISPDDPVSKNVSHFVVFVKMDDKRFFLRRFIADHPDSKIIAFVRTRVRAERLHKALDRAGIDAVTLHGEKDQQERMVAMDGFKQGATHILIATDVSARGIDIPDVDYVINYDLPEVTENYVHRVGRTGRGTRKGIAVSYCSPEEEPLLEKIQSFLDKPIETIPVSRTDYATTLSLSKTRQSIQDLIQAQEDWESTQKKKKNRRKKKKH